MEILVTAPPTMIGHGFPPGPFEEAYFRAANALIDRALLAEACVRELGEMIAWERMHRIDVEGVPFHHRGPSKGDRW